MIRPFYENIRNILLLHDRWAESNGTDGQQLISLKEIDLSNMDFTGVWLYELKISRVSFKKAKLSKTTLQYSSIDESDFDEAEIFSANFDYAKFIKSSLNKIKASESTFTDTDFIEVFMEYAELTNSYFNGTRFIKVDLSFSDFSGSTFENIYFEEVELKGSIGFNKELIHSIHIRTNNETIFLESDQAYLWFLEKSKY